MSMRLSHTLQSFCYALAAFFLLLGVLISMPAFAQKTEGQVAFSGTVAQLVDNHRFRLDNGRRVRLAGIEVPNLSLGQPQFSPWPYAQESFEALRDLILDKEVMVFHRPGNEDRDGYLFAHVYLKETGLWVQQHLLGLGLARVQTYSHTAERAEDMLGIERAAREKKEGIWGVGFYTVRTPQQAAGDIGRFQLVQGTVTTVNQSGNHLYLNFGPDWRKDFGVQIPVAMLPQFARLGFSPRELRGRTVLVRGWLRDWNGPTITLSHPEQLQVVPGG